MQGIQSEMAYRILRPDGSVRFIEARSFPVRDAEGKLIRIVGIAEDATVRREKETALKGTHEKLNVALEELNKQAQDTAKLAELVDILQSCQNSEEAYKITENVLQGMLRSTAGALCITSPSRDVVEMVASWGNVLGAEKAFRPDDCWALRRGKIHRVKDPASPQRCAHISKPPSNGYVCVPLAAQGETLGVLYVGNVSEPAGSAVEDGPDPAEALERQATVVAERISLALSNLRLREVLRGQSIRDPLTGLFNRRFMEESLERELRRAIRGKQQVALLMLDIDHFKRFNDTFGHQAGDALLRALGNLLKENTRGQDVVCRYGGEEFAFVLAGASLDAARKRAELLREDIKQLNAQHGGQLLGAVTLSIGIAVFPDNGDTPEHLLKAADDALYRAKEEGRDGIITA
jgi:diguanylate cyclase (GGDEF)-like protein